MLILGYLLSMAEQKCKQCGHARRMHSIQGCLYDGACPYGCMVKFTDKSQFE